MTAIYRWLFWRLCAARNALDAAIRYCRIRAGYAPRKSLKDINSDADADGEHGVAS